MDQTGKVMEVYKNNKAKILMRKHSACGDCGACQHGKENMDINIIALNEIDAKVGEFVEVNMETQNVLSAAFIAYVIPLIVLIIGVAGGSFLLGKIGFNGNIEIYSIFIGLFGMAITFIMIKLYENQLNNDKRYMPSISRIIKE